MSNLLIIFKNFIKRKLAEFIFPEISKICSKEYYEKTIERIKRNPKSI